MDTAPIRPVQTRAIRLQRGGGWSWTRVAAWAPLAFATGWLLSIPVASMLRLPSSGPVEPAPQVTVSATPTDTLTVHASPPPPVTVTQWERAAQATKTVTATTTTRIRSTVTRTVTDWSTTAAPIGPQGEPGSTWDGPLP